MRNKTIFIMLISPVYKKKLIYTQAAVEPRNTRELRSRTHEIESACARVNFSKLLAPRGV